ncbi:MAG: transcriptional repressor AgaR [Gammaproteobacteria bacterium]|nr:transcriptional repressor AgaR [Gammaproteobacteria bacterium]
MLKAAGSVQVLSLARKFGVSAVTIRKDLTFLESLGISTRTYGGAMLSQGDRPVIERPIEHKQQLFAKEKSAIGRVAAGYVESSDAIILDSGTTTFQVAAQLVDQKGVTVVTNGLNVMNKLSHHKHLKLIMLGGMLRLKNLSFFGAQAEHALRELHVDKLFLGVDGFHMERGITTHFEAEAELNRLMRDAASRIIVITDSSKFGRICLHKIMEPAQVSMVITDSGIPDEYRSGLESLGIELVIAD